MKGIFELLDEVSHQLNSPLASAKSYIYLTNRVLEKNDVKKAGEYLTLLDKKIDLLTSRIDIVLSLMKFETSTVAFTYEFFPISDITNDKNHHVEIMSDKALLSRVFAYTYELTGTDSFSLIRNPKTVSLVFVYTKRLESDDKDIKTEIIEKSIIIHQITNLLGGTITDTDKKIEIVLPLKPPAK